MSDIGYPMVRTKLFLMSRQLAHHAGFENKGRQFAGVQRVVLSALGWLQLAAFFYRDRIIAMATFMIKETKPRQEHVPQDGHLVVKNERNILAPPAGSHGGQRALPLVFCASCMSCELEAKKPDFSVVPPPREHTDEHQQHVVRTANGRRFDDVVEISEDDIRHALFLEAKKHKYWKASAVKKMRIEHVEHFCCYHYTLASYTELRSTIDATEAYNVSQLMESHGLGTSSDTARPCGSGIKDSISPWDYEVLPDEDFVDQNKMLELPGTSKLTGCAACNSEGVIHCFHCRGYGTDKCTYCRGTGMKAGVAHPAVYTHPMIATFPHSDIARGYPGSGTAIVRPTGTGGLSYGVGTPIHFMAKAGLPPPGIGHHDLCIFCQGRGIRDCYQCKGQCKKPCTTCGGNGSVRTFTKLRVYFSVEHNDFYTETHIPEKLLRTVSGQIIFAECQPYVLPVTKFPVQEVNENSKRLCALHLQKSMGYCRVLKQRHTLEAIPVAKVTYSMDNRPGVFWVYGAERLCFVPSYPSKCAIL
uniref:Protein SSUH2 homolog n=1 Tax=Steinernema glaseri TaxID=37863 RepID=A0A1I7ZID5_9BILA